MKTNLRKYLALLCALALTIGCLPAGVFAASHKTMTVETSGQQGIYDVSLSVPGEADKLGVDIVYVMSGTKLWNDGLVPAIVDAIGAVVSGGTTVNLGIIPFAYDIDAIMDLTPIKTMDDVNGLEQAIYDAYAAAQAKGFVGNGNLENSLILAKKMLSNSALADHPERQHLILISTGHVYEFNGGENNEYASCAPVYDTTNKVVRSSGGDWSYLRNGGSSKYYIPNAIVKTYNKNKDKYDSAWDCYWSYIEKWVANDKADEANGNPHVYNFGLAEEVTTSDYNFNKLTTTELKKYPNLAYRTTLAENQLDTANAIIYERAMWETYEYAKANIIDAGINFYPIYAGMNTSGAYDNVPGGTQYVGHSFMNMLAGGKAAQYSYTEDNGAFFAPIKEKILYSCSAGSTVENALGFVEGENGYNFDFKADGTITLTVGGVDYTTSVADTKEGYDLSLAFTDPEATEPTFWLDYVKGNGTTEEKFILTFGEDVSLERPLVLDYQVELVNAADTAALKTVDDKLYISNGATFKPVDSDGKAGAEEQFNRPYVINWAATDIEISNAKEFVEFADVANGKHPFFAGEKHSFVDQIIHLTNDIDLGDYWWYFYDTSVGEEKIDHRIDGFRGIFDGTKNETENYTIYNVKFHAPEGSSKPNESFLSLSMFRTVYGTLQNFNIENVGGYWNDDHTELKPLITGPSTRFFTLAYKTSGALIKNITAKNIDAEMLNPEHISEEMIATDLYTSFNGLLGVVTWESGGTCGNGAYTKVENCHVVDANAVLYNNNQYAGGGFAYKASEMSEFYDCSVDGLTVEIMGNSDNFGGFIGEIGLASLAIRCTVNNVDVTVHGQNNAGMGGFMGDTVGGTGWGDSVHIEDCSVENTTIDVATINAPLGGFVGDLIGGRSAFFERNTVADTVELIGTNLGEGNGTGYPGVGGFLGGLFGRSNLQANNEHAFTNCSTSAKILAGAAPAGGFVGTALLGSSNQMRVVFDTCAFNGIVNTANTAVAFVGIGDIGTKGVDRNYDEYNNCTVSGALVKGQSPENGQQVTLGGDYSYEMEADSGYATLESTIHNETTYSSYKMPVAVEEPVVPAVAMFRLMRNAMPEATNDLVKVEFYLDQEATEPLHVFERYQNTALDGTNYPALEESPEYALSEKKMAEVFGYMAHNDGLFQVTWFCEDGTEFTADTLVTGDMKVYATLTPVSADVTLEGEITMDSELADGFDIVLNPGEEPLQTIPSENGKFTFAPLNFDKIGTYTFTVGQVIGDVETTVYDASVYTVTITVSVENGKIVTDVQFLRNAEATDKITFENKTISNVNIIVNGNSYMNSDPTDEYEFVLMEGEEIKQNIYAMFGEFFTTLSFQKPGTYTYTISQVNGEDPTIAYDLSVYTLIVTVVREGDKLVATTQIKLGEETVDTLTFANKTFDSIDVTLGGSVNLDEESTDEFQFILMQGEDILQTIPSENGQFTFAPMNFNQIGTYTFTVSQIAGEDEDIVYDASVYTVVITVQRQDYVLVATTQILLGDETMEQISFSNETVIPETPMDPDGDGMFNVLLVMLVSMALLGTCVVLKRKEN